VVKAVLFGIVLTLVQHSQEPRLKSTEGDARHYRLTNPLDTPIEVTLDCGSWWDPLVFKVGPKRTEPVVIVGGYANNDLLVWCRIKEWKRAE
jgi:hypothetical protein